MKKSVDKEKRYGYNGDRLAASGTCNEERRRKAKASKKKEKLPLENRIAIKIRDPERVRSYIYMERIQDECQGCLSEKKQQSQKFKHESLILAQGERWRRA